MAGSLPTTPYFNDDARGAGEKRSVLDDMIDNIVEAGPGALSDVTLDPAWDAITDSPGWGIPQYSGIGQLVIVQGACEYVATGAATNGDAIGSIAAGSAPDVRLMFESFGLRWDIHPDGSITYEGWTGFSDYICLNAVYRKGGS
jgi:hypothetical protein